ncbi:hypothetical protein GQ43DRAFT_470015 [Delitschia confertaspora ATCC 74209]|uniref:Uncharacterized protein n=1 Tax=Delitschia confertaspora ATCC 74209 TaxID=1513339 RepID=A0A9P4JPL1_9PLEO|nr:hypothetical protein GQ43DRAFT_470015 [Delitschia confertaspora ATCC 74209]
MAPSTANSARTQRKAAPRIIPVVPLPFSRPNRAARPITPEDTVTDVAPVKPTQQPSAPASETNGEQNSGAMHVPLTPDSRVSPLSPKEGKKASPQSSSSGPRGQVAEETVNSQVVTRPQSESKRFMPEDKVMETSPTTSNGSKLPNGLPPPFRPSAKPANMSPALDGPNQSPTQLPPHRAHPSVDSIVFGAMPKSPNISSTPHDMEPEMRAPQNFTRPPPGFLVPQFAPPFYTPSHSHQQSDPNAPFLYPAMSLPPTQAPYSYNRDYPPTAWPGHPSFATPYPPPPPQDTVTMAGARHTPRSLSRSPVISQSLETAVRSEYDGSRHVAQLSNGSAVPALAPKPEDNALELADYMCSQFGNPEFSDIVLQVRSPFTHFPLAAHGIIVSRSRAIASAIHASKASNLRTEDSRLLVDISTTDKFITVQSLSAAVKHLYGLPFVASDGFPWDLPHFQHNADDIDKRNEARTRMEQALSLVAAGSLLQIPSFTARSADLVQKLIRWDTVDQVLHFALNPYSDAGLARENGVQEVHVDSQADQPQQANYGSFSSSMLGDVLDFIAFSIPANFKLYNAAPELVDNPRLPLIAEPKVPAHNPRLSKIRFGDVPAEDDAKPVYATRILSSLLISLPFSALQSLFSHFELGRRLGWSFVADLMRAVVDERENRRQKAWKSFKSSSDGPVEKYPVDTLYWEEHVERSHEHPSGLILTRQRLVGQPGV